VSRVSVARLLLAFGGAGLFLWATRADNQTLRWVAIGVIAVALLLRFAEKHD
jgi:hypothetical protein